LASYGRQTKDQGYHREKGLLRERHFQSIEALYQSPVADDLLAVARSFTL